MRARRLGLLPLALSLASPPILADEFHYKSVPVGERAAGMGGAYVAISDDPSGVFYNPAGIVFSLENYFSLSANAFHVSEEKFENIIPGQDYTYRSQGIVPAFFGMTQQFGKGKFGFAVIVPNADLVDLDDKLTGLSSKTDKPGTFSRRLFRQDTTYLLGPAYAREVAHNLTLGVSFLGQIRFLKEIDYQLLQYNPVPDGKYFLQNSTLSGSAYGLDPKVGVQWMPTPKWSFGLTVARPVTITGSGNYRSTRTKDSTDGKPLVQTGTFSGDMETAELSDFTFELPEPIMVELGVARFFSKSTLLTTQLDVNGPQKGFRGFPIQTTFNWALGGEQYLSESWAVRTGVFSNNARTPSIDPSGSTQKSHVNELGFALGVSLFKPGSSLTLGGTYTYGKGEGQVFDAGTEVQTVVRKSMTVYMTGSYQL